MRRPGDVQHARGGPSASTHLPPARSGREMRLKRLARQAPGACSLRAAFLLVAGLFAVLLVLRITGVWGGRVQQLQRDLVEFRRRWDEQAFPTAAGRTADASQASRGIVICAGGPLLLANTYVSVHVLRTTLNCSLPIEIYHDGPADLPDGAVEAFKAFRGVSFVDLQTLEWPQQGARPAKVHGYVQKILSLYSTRFSQVLLLDADSQPLRDPAALFEAPAFREAGDLFWSDYWAQGSTESPRERVYGWLGLRAPWLEDSGWRCAESGQVLFDRLRHADVLEWLWFLNAHAPLLYRNMLGDKDTFEMAFMLAGKRAAYRRVPHGPGLAASRLQAGVRHPKLHIRLFFPREEQARFLRLGMLQFAPDGSPAFLHRTERAKFARRDGYSLDVMRVAHWTPPLSAALAKQVRGPVWRMHSVPLGLADLNCTCCVPDASTAAVLSRAGLKPPEGPPPGQAACPGKLPLFPAVWLGPQANAAVEAGFVGYRQFASQVAGLRT